MTISYMSNRKIVAALCLCLSGPAAAGPEFATFDGRTAVVTGDGGTKIVKNGIEWWTFGSPPRPHTIVGIITDKRGNKVFSGKTMGSAKIAKMVQEAGGDAVIFAGSNSQVTGTRGNAFASASGDSAFVTGSDKLAIDTTTRLIVIRYVKPE